jgi:hypothetical protein
MSLAVTIIIFLQIRWLAKLIGPAVRAPDHSAKSREKPSAE